MCLSRRRRHERRIENVTLRDVDKVEIHAAESGGIVARNTICRGWQGHRARRHFMKAIIDRARFAYV